MLKLLIVDDNDFERNALSSYINWDILGLQLVDTAYNGQEGINKVRLHKPDIIISDIKMPVMDGIEMAKIIKAEYPDIKIIFSSGYDDVALLKEALELRAFNYIVKPVNPDELVKAIKKVVSIIIDEKLSSVENNSIIKEYKDNLSLLQSKFLENLILKETKAEELNEVFNRANNLKLRIIGSYKLVLIDLDFENEDIFDVSCRTDLIMGELRNTCEGKNVMFLEIRHNRIVAIIYYLDQRHSNTEAMIDSISEKLKEIKEDFKFKFALGVSSTAPNLTDLYRLFKECREAVSMKVELGYEQVICFEKLELRNIDAKKSPKDIIKEIIAKIFLSVLEGEGFSSEITELINLGSSMEGSKLENCKSIFISLFNAISRQMENRGESFEKVVGDDIDFLTNIISAKIIPDIIEYVNNTLDSIASYYIKSKTSKDAYIVDEILSILNNEYEKPITLTYLSERVYLSPNYLRILFKNKMNISIQDYLTNVRINKAKELLKQNCYKVHEVGEMVGYPNSTYFNIVFKNYVNLTPGDYRSKYYSTDANK